MGNTGSGFFARFSEDGSRQPLRDHLDQAARIAGGLAAKVGLGPAGSLLGGAHDLGKYSGEFQDYLRRSTVEQDSEPTVMKRGDVDHSTAGAQFVFHELQRKGKTEGVVGEILALCIASHHSGLIDCLDPHSIDKLSLRLQKVEAKAHLAEAWSNAETSVREILERKIQDQALVEGVKAQVLKICGHDETEQLRKFKIGLFVRFLFSCLIDADRTNSADFANTFAATFRQHGNYPRWIELSAVLERHINSFVARNPVDELRRRVAQDCLAASARGKGTFTLTVPTGGGKTLSGLLFAVHHADHWDMDRVIFVSPYTSIVDQNAAVARKVLELSGAPFGSIVLEHHSNLTPKKETWRSKILAENWDAPIVFTTMVQILESLFGDGTRAVRRMHQMANAVIVFDEIQTLPVRCVHLFNNAVNYLVEQCGSTVVLCTATQPRLHKVDASKGAIRLRIDSELVSDVGGLFDGLRRCEAYDRRKAGGWEDAEVARLALTEALEMGSCLVVVNTKREAQSIFRILRESGEAVRVFHLSTNMCPAHRVSVLETIQSELEAAERPVVCVSTQLIEAGVDVDFGAVIRALAGLDSIAQAAGRCNPHGRRVLGRVHIVNSSGELPKQLREIRMAQEAAQRVLDECAIAGELRRIDLADPSVVERYFEYYFFDRSREMSYSVDSVEIGRSDDLLNMLGENKLALAEAVRRKEPPKSFFRQSFMSASKAFEPIESETQGVIVPYGLEGKAVIADLFAGFGPDKQVSVLRRAQQFTVNVFPAVMMLLKSAEAIKEVHPGTRLLVLDEKFYSKEFGLSVDGSSEMELQSA